MNEAWERWLEHYLTAISRNSDDPVIAKIAAKRKAEDLYRPVFEAGYTAGAGIS